MASGNNGSIIVIGLLAWLAFRASQPESSDPATALAEAESRQNAEDARLAPIRSILSNWACIWVGLIGFPISRRWAIHRFIAGLNSGLSRESGIEGKEGAPRLRGEGGSFFSSLFFSSLLLISISLLISSSPLFPFFLTP